MSANQKLHSTFLFTGHLSLLLFTKMLRVFARRYAPLQFRLYQMKFYFLIPIIGLGTICLAQESRIQHRVGSSDTNFHWMDFDQFRTSYQHEGEFHFNVKTRVIRRLQYKGGTLSSALNDSLNEYLDTCEPISGEGECHYCYRYYLVDSLWIIGTAQDKFFHRVDLLRVVFPDTVVIDDPPTNLKTKVTENNPSIAILDTLLDKTIIASITVVLIKYSHDGINNQKYWFATIDQFRTEKPD